MKHGTSVELDSAKFEALIAETGRTNKDICTAVGADPSTLAHALKKRRMTMVYLNAICREIGIDPDKVIVKDISKEVPAEAPAAVTQMVVDTSLIEKEIAELNKRLGKIENLLARQLDIECAINSMAATIKTMSTDTLLYLKDALQ